MYRKKIAKIFAESCQRLHSKLAHDILNIFLKELSDAYGIDNVKSSESFYEFSTVKVGYACNDN